MTFREVLAQVIDWLQHDKRVSYRALKREFDIDDDYIQDLKEELLFSPHPVSDEDERGLSWTGDIVPTPSVSRYSQQGLESESRFHAVLPFILALLRREKRVTYRILKDVFGLNDGLLENLCDELFLRQVAIDEGGKVLVWTGQAQSDITPSISQPSKQVYRDVEEVIPIVDSSSSLINEVEAQDNGLSTESVLSRSAPEAENRQLTVVFCDLAESTKLSQQLDPEDLREVLRAYQETAAEVIERYDGHIAQYLGDGLLIYFGWPKAHENDAERAVYVGLEIPEAIARLNSRLEDDYGIELDVRIGIHTGPVVVGEVGRGSRSENLALGETPNIAARLEGLAQANTVVISPATVQLVQRSFVLEELGEHDLKGVSEPMLLYTAVGTRETEYDEHDGILPGGFDALVGRDEEIGLLLRRWEQSKNGLGQVVLISGEAGIGKSSLVEVLRRHAIQEGMTRLAFRCSPYHVNSAFYPIIEYVQRALGWQPGDSPKAQLTKLEQGLEGTRMVLEEAIPILSNLLSLELPQGGYSALNLLPQELRQQTQDLLVAWLLEEAERQPVLAVWEDLHWADPSTLEVLGLIIEQCPMVAMCQVLTFRPEFEPPWPRRTHLTPISLNRLERSQVEALLMHLARDKALPPEVVDHIAIKTDGNPLYVEELTKVLLESDLLRETEHTYVLTGSLSEVSIPATLQDSLMARLDQLGRARDIAQLGAVCGREFTYGVLQAISGQDDAMVQAGLAQLVQVELLYQRGRPPNSTYIFKHALVQDAAYTSLLRRTRQQIHQRIAQHLEAHDLESRQAHPELLAHHFAEAGLKERAVDYWRQAGEHAIRRFAYAEALAHLNRGLNELEGLSKLPEHSRQELDLLAHLGMVLMAVIGNTSQEAERTYRRAWALCQELGDTPQRYPVLIGLWRVVIFRLELSTALEIGEQLLSLAQESQEPFLLMEAYYMMGYPLFWKGESLAARIHVERGLALYEAQAHHTRDMGNRLLAPELNCASLAALTCWMLGYPDQGLQRVNQALSLAARSSDPYSQAMTHFVAAFFHQCCRNPQATQAHAEAVLAMSTEHGIPTWWMLASVLLGWALCAQGEEEIGLAKLQQSPAFSPDPEIQLARTHCLAQLAEIHGARGEVNEGLMALTEGLALADRLGDRWYEAELYRLQGELLLQTDNVINGVDSDPESCMQKAMEIARSQEAKSLELRSATSLARLWHSQGKRDEAYEVLKRIYEWFTEGLDTADLQAAKSLLDELAEGAP